MPTPPLSNSLVRKIIEESGCFSLIYRRDRHLNRGGKRLYFYFRPHFVLAMRDDKKDLIEQIRQTLGCGKITALGKQVRLDIYSPQEFSGLISLLDKYTFGTPARRNEFELWREAVGLIRRNSRKKINAERGKQGFVSTWQNFDEKDLKRLFRIREELKKYKKWKKSDYKWTNSLMARGY